MAASDDSPHARAQRRFIASLREAQALGIITDLDQLPVAEQLEVLSRFLHKRLQPDDMALILQERPQGRAGAKIAQWYSEWLRFTEIWSDADLLAAFEQAGIDVTRLDLNDPNDRMRIWDILLPDESSS
jgi:hypothetical protein